MAPSQTWPPESDVDLEVWLRNFFQTGEIAPLFIEVRMHHDTTEVVLSALYDPELCARVSVLMPRLLQEWKPTDGWEICHRMSTTAGYAPNPENVATLIAMYDEEQDEVRKLYLLCVLAGYYKCPETHSIFRAQLHHLPFATGAMRALCHCLPEEAALNFSKFLDLRKPESGLIRSLIAGVPDAHREAFLAIAGKDPRFSAAIATMFLR